MARDNDMLLFLWLQALDSPLAANSKDKPLAAHVASISRKAKGVRIARNEGKLFKRKSLAIGHDSYTSVAHYTHSRPKWGIRLPALITCEHKKIYYLSNVHPKMFA
jgi:hypothetical protein